MSLVGTKVCVWGILICAEYGIQQRNTEKTICKHKPLIGEALNHYILNPVHDISKCDFSVRCRPDGAFSVKLPQKKQRE